MNLVVCATAAEAAGIFPEGLPEGWELLVSGVGPVACAVSVTRSLAKGAYGCALQLGIAGAYRESGLYVGALARVERDFLPELGVEEADGSFTPWQALGMGGEVSYAGSVMDEAPSAALRLALASLPGARGHTVLGCTGTLVTAARRSPWAELESMEGAAFFAAASACGVKAWQVRAVSNEAGVRDKSAWRIPRALAALAAWSGEAMRV